MRHGVARCGANRAAAARHLRFFAAPFDEEARDTATNQYRQFESPTWVFYRSGIYHLSDLTGGMSAPLSAAVRASANFPFGFPLVEVQARNRLWYSTTMADRSTPDTASRMVRLTDGGALNCDPEQVPPGQ